MLERAGHRGRESERGRHEAGSGGRMRTRPPTTHRRQTRGLRTEERARARRSCSLCGRRRMTQVESSEADGGAHGRRREGRGLCPVCFPRASPSSGRGLPAREGALSAAPLLFLAASSTPSPDSIMCRSPPPPPPPLSLPPDRPPSERVEPPSNLGRASERQVSGRRTWTESGLALPCGRRPSATAES